MQEIIIRVIAVVCAITIHEFSHAYCAYQLGDDTAKRHGRLTLNPIKHFDIFGTLMLLLVYVGWAKPVPINPYNFKDMKIGCALTAAAGPASNFLVAIIIAMVYRSIFHVETAGLEAFRPTGIMQSLNHGIVQYALIFTVFINVALGLFNLIPIPPLDGSRIVGAFMSDRMFFIWSSWERKGMVLLMIIFATSFIFQLNIIGRVIYPPLMYILRLLIGG
jgi:Zn-dependent protease